MEDPVKLQPIDDDFITMEQNAKFYREHKELYDVVKEMFGENIGCTVLKNISKNPEVFAEIKEYGYINYIHIEQAFQKLQELQKISPSYILIYFHNMGIYSLFTMKKYPCFYRKLHNITRISNKSAIVDPYQIVFANTPQKLVFCCDGNDQIIKKLEKYLNEKFMLPNCINEICDNEYRGNGECNEPSHKNGIIVRNGIIDKEITIPGITVNSFEETQLSFLQVCEYIREQCNDREASRSIYPKTLIRSQYGNYIMFNVGRMIEERVYYSETINGLVTCSSQNIVNNIKINNKTSNNLSITDQTKNWIRNNPPNGKEKTTDYYNRYITEVPGGLLDNMFGKFVRSNNIKKIHKNNQRFYTLINTESSAKVIGEQKPKKPPQYSKIAIQWLKTLPNYSNIQHAENNKEYRIPNTRYSADGYDPATNTIYEFHGSYWHGDPRVYPDCDYNETTKCTFGELYKRTIQKEQTILGLGYNLVVMWEADFTNKAIVSFEDFNKLNSELCGL